MPSKSYYPTTSQTSLKENVSNNSLKIQDAKQLKSIIKHEISRLQTIYKSIDAFVSNEDEATTTFDDFVY